MRIYFSTSPIFVFPLNIIFSGLYKNQNKYFIKMYILIDLLLYVNIVTNSCIYGHMFVNQDQIPTVYSYFNVCFFHF